MANIKSSKKDIKRNAKNRAKNVAAKSALKTFIKKVRVAAGAAQPDTAVVASSLTVAVKNLDKAAQRGIIHPNQAARRKSRIAKAANKALAAKA